MYELTSAFATQRFCMNVISKEPKPLPVTSVYITRWKFENAALFLRLGLPSTLIRHENEAFLTTVFESEIFKNVGFSFLCGRKSFWKRNFSKTMASRKSGDFSDQVFLKHKSKMTGDWFRRSVWDENINCVFSNTLIILQVKTKEITTVKEVWILGPY